MENKSFNKSFYVGFLVGFIIMTGITFIILYNLEDMNNDEFYKEYIIALNNNHVANAYLEMADANLDTGNWYIGTGEYYYEDAVDYFDISKEQSKDAENLLIVSISKFKSLKESTPNEFFDVEIDNRIEQSEILLELVKQYYNLADYVIIQLHEVNYGSESRATEYNNKYNNLIVDLNDNLKKLDVVNQRIDLKWEQDWYTSFQDTELY